MNLGGSKLACAEMYATLFDSRDINPHIPQYISQAPWYVSLNRYVHRVKLSPLTSWPVVGHASLLAKDSKSGQSSMCDPNTSVA